MEVKIKRNDQVQVVKISGIKGKHQKKYLTLASRVSSNQTPELMEEFLDYRIQMILETTNGVFKNADEVEDLEIEELNKITKAIESKFLPSESSNNLIKNS